MKIMISKSEIQRPDAARKEKMPWKKWGPYLIGKRYLDVSIECAKESPEEILIKISLKNRGPDACAPWSEGSAKPNLKQINNRTTGPSMTCSAVSFSPATGTLRDAWRLAPRFDSRYAPGLKLSTEVNIIWH